MSDVVPAHQARPKALRQNLYVYAVLSRRAGGVSIGVNLSPHKDLHAYLRLLEQVLINTVGTFGLAADRRAGKTGIWLGPRKIAAIGVAVKKWTTYHGFALNVNPDLTPFSGIVPCGITDGTVTSMKAELGQDLELTAVKQVLANEFWRMLPVFLVNG